jgi:parallel beta-helix repeat protein
VELLDDARLPSLIVACAMMMLLLLPYHGRAQDSLVVSGEVLVVARSSLTSSLREISIDTLDLSQQAQVEFDWLRSIGVEHVQALNPDGAGVLSEYFTLYYDSSLCDSSMRAELATHDLIESVQRIITLPGEFYGCSPLTGNEAYQNDPGRVEAWWIHAFDQYYDQDMSLLETWEFTMGDTSVITMLSAGPWCIAEQYRHESLWREFGDQIIDGVDWGCGSFNPDPDWGQGHTHTVMRIIAAQHDTTTGGTVGIAPLTRLIPYRTLNNAEMLEALILGASHSAVSYAISQTIPQSPEYETVMANALDMGILPIISVGRSPLTPIKTVTTPYTLNVAANNGSYVTSISKIGPYPSVNITAAGPFGGPTSFAGAAAAGVAALVKSVYPDMTAHELREKLLEAVDPMHDELWSPDLNETQLGTGRLNAYQAIAQRKSGEITEDETWSGPIYVAEDVIVRPGATLTIDLTPVPNMENRTHVRFGSLSRTKPPQVIKPRIIVEGTLIVRGEEDNKILFSRLQRNIPTSTGWIGQWGGIEIRHGGALDMDHALIEHAWKGIVTHSDDVLIQNSIICNEHNSPGITFQMYNPTQGLTPTVRNCEFRSAFGRGIGIAVWRGDPLIDSCRFEDLGVGIHYYSWFARGEARNNTISNTRDHGILCVDDPRPLITGNTISGNLGNGISLMGNLRYPLLHDNLIEDNGRAGLQYNPPLRTGDGIYLFRATARLHENTINDNRYGLHLQSFSTALGGDGVTGPSGTEGLNSFTDNSVSIYADDHAGTRLGYLYGYQQYYGHNNTSSVDAGNGMHVEARNVSTLWLHCNTWSPDGASLFFDGFGSDIFRFPHYQDCQPPAYQYPDSDFHQAMAELEDGELNQALIIYDNLARTADEAIVLRALGGVQNVFYADSLFHHVTVIDSLLQDYAQLYQNASQALRGNIAYCQGLVAMSAGRLVEADSLLRVADGALTSPAQARNNLTQLLYLHLYCNADTTEAVSILQDIETRFMGDSLIQTARDLYRYYVDIESGGYRYIGKPRRGALDEAVRPVAGDAVFTLKRNYPNPFNPVTTIEYEVHDEATLHLLITDMYGRKVRSTRPALYSPGSYHYTFDAGELPSGVYFATVYSDSQSSTIRMLFLK